MATYPTQFNEVARAQLKAARIHLVNVQMMYAPINEEYEMIGDLIEEVEQLLGVR